jgi:hypothetical protein
VAAEVAGKSGLVKLGKGRAKEQEKNGRTRKRRTRKMGEQTRKWRKNRKMKKETKSSEKQKEEKKEKKKSTRVLTCLMICPGCCKGLILGMTAQGSSSSDVQNGCVSGTAKQMKARHAQYYHEQQQSDLLLCHLDIHFQDKLTGLPGLL